MAKFTVSMKICSISQKSPPGLASWEQAVGRAFPGESPRIPDMALLHSRSIPGAMVGSAPNPRDEPAVTEAACAGWCCRVKCAVTCARGSHLLRPWASGSWLCSLRAVETELFLLPGESSCVFLSFTVFLWLLLCFTLFPTDPGKLAVYLRPFVVVDKDGKKSEDYESRS